jgi:hypothetical protein
MALEHDIKKGKLNKAEDDVHESGILTPLYEEGEKGGNPESPAAEELGADFHPPDPMGFLSKLGGGHKK